ncbi:MAG: M20 family metallopeptidase [Epsilonproteobacteria bacterium]|nr:peptidase M20 [Campylobacterota bacterium]NPA56116.1 M20 family metallopeptidase [Campylobacterota bacterium]
MEYDFSELAEVIRINSYTKNVEGVNRVGELFREKLEELGYDCEKIRSEIYGDHLYFHAPSTREGKGRILLLGHLDTVFPPGTFEEFREDGEWIYGPGVCDMKGGIMVMVEALRTLPEIANIDILLVSDEEIGSDDSRVHTRRIAGEYDYTLVFEAAGPHGEVVTGRKGIGTFYIDIDGRAAHAGNNYRDGIDANAELAHKLLSLVNLTDVEEGTTVNVGKIEGGIGANTISPHAHMVFEARFTKASERDRVLQSINQIVNTPFIPGTKATLRGGLQRDVMEENRAQREFLKLLEEWSGKTIPTERRGGGSDANIAASAGSTTLDGFGPYGDGDHTIHERASKRSYMDRIELVSSIFRGFLAHQPSGRSTSS